MVRVSALAVVILVCAGSPVLAQTVQTKAPIDDIKIRTIPRQVEIDLDRVPDAWIRFNHNLPSGTPPWAITRAPKWSGGGIRPATPGVWAQGVLVAPREYCPLFDAIVDLSVLRANGFRLSGVDYQALPPKPAGYNENQSGPRRGVGNSPAELKTVVLSGAVYGMPPRSGIRMCWAGFHARLKVRGPEGVDPVTGRHIAPRRSPN